MCKIIDYSEKSFALVGDDTKLMKNDLRKLGGKYNPNLTCGKGWIFSNKSREGVDAYLTNGLIYVTLGDTIAPENKEPKATKNETKQTKKQDEFPYCYDDFFKAFKPIEPNEKDKKYYKETFLPFKLRSGKLFMIDKPKIKTQFCFPENGGESYDIAVNNCHVLDTNEKAFINENLEKFNRNIEEIIRGEQGLMSWWKCDDIYYLCADTATPHNKMSEEEREDILAILKQERAKFEKRLQSYLKRYGLSKIHTWTYWSER